MNYTSSKIKDYQNLLKQVIKHQWEIGNYNIKLLKTFSRNSKNPPTDQCFESLGALLD